jgi:regulatory protein YycI of two-component signal transduction system YycFG
MILKSKKNLFIIFFIILGMLLVLKFRDHNFQRAVEACIAGSKQLATITDLDAAKKFCEEQISKKD